jgi:hypothetical protein
MISVKRIVHTIDDYTEEILEWGLLGRGSTGGGEVSVQDDVPDEMGLGLPSAGGSDTGILLIVLYITALQHE